MDATLNRILELLKSSGMKKITFLTQLGLDKSAIGAWMRGDNKSYLKYLPKIAEIFGVSLDWLAGTEQKEKSADPGEPTDLERILEKQPGLMFNGMPVTETDRKKLLTAMRIAMEIADREDKK